MNKIIFLLSEILETYDKEEALRFLDDEN